MIREFDNSNISEVMNIWLEANILSHSFISKDYWIQMYPIVEKILPNARIFLYIEDQMIVGFIGTNDQYIEGIFVLPEYQSNGYGKKLLNHVKSLYSDLKLRVYTNNARAVGFYTREGFVIIDKDIDTNTNEQELVMSWSSIEK